MRKGSAITRLLLVAALAVTAVSIVAVPATRAANAWVNVANMPTARADLAAVAVGNTVYVIGGRDSNGGTGIVEAYDAATDSWTCSVGDTAAGCTSNTLAPMPTPRAGLAATLGNDGKIYVIGGASGFSGSGGPSPSVNALNTVEAYDPNTNTWTCSVGDTSSGCASSTLAPLPTARWFLAAANVGGEIYVVGGNNYSTLNTVDVYDPVANSWSSSTSLPTARYGLTAGAIGNTLYVVGGVTYDPQNYTNIYYDYVEAYDTASHTWTCSTDDTAAGCTSNTLAPMPTPRFNFAAAVSGGLFYAIGGAGSNGAGGTGFKDQVEAYDPAANAWSSLAPISYIRDSLSAAATRDGTIYTFGGANFYSTYYYAPPYNVAQAYYTTNVQMNGPLYARPGVAFTIDVTIRDNSGNVMTGYTGTLHFTGSDAGATLPADYTFTSADAGHHSFSVTLATEGNQTITATDTQNPGFTGSISILVDGTAPTVSASATNADGTGYTFGAWTHQAVTVTLSAADNAGGSGLQSVSYQLDGGSTQTYSAPFTIATEGHHTVTYWATDNAGNSSTPQTAAVDIDLTPPTITITAPQGSYILNQHVSASYSCADPQLADGTAGSGVASCTGTLPDGATVDTSTLGTFTFMVNASDNAGNTSSQTSTYQIGYGIKLLYNPDAGVRRPLFAWIEVQLVDANGSNLSSAQLPLHIVDLAPAGQPYTGGPGNLSGNFLYSPYLTRSGGGYITLVNTGPLTPGKWVLYFTVGNGTTIYSAPFTVN